MNLIEKLFTRQSIRQFAVPLSIVLGILVLCVSAPVIAQDLSDNETCMECHADTERGPPKNPDRPQVHTPHPDEVLGSEVDCTNCHDEAPTK